MLTDKRGDLSNQIETVCCVAASFPDSCSELSIHFLTNQPRRMSPAWRALPGLGHESRARCNAHARRVVSYSPPAGTPGTSDNEWTEKVTYLDLDQIKNTHFYLFYEFSFS